MKLGDIKLQTLSLIFPDAVFEYADKDLEDLLFNLRSSSNYSSYLVASIGAINRAFTVIEQRGLSKKCFFETRLEFGNRIGDFYYFDLSGKREICTLEEVYLVISGKREQLSFEMMGNTLAVKCSRTQGDLIIVYREKIKRIDFLTSNNEQIVLPCGIEEIIPYFVKADLLSGERPDKAGLSREIFEKMLEEYASRNREGGFFDCVYSLGSV